MARNQYFDLYSTTTEQDLHDDLIVEAIQIHGLDMYYIPRASLDTDLLYSEYTSSAFVGAIPIEMYVRDVFAFGGDGAFVSAFGPELRDQVVLQVARTRFNVEITSNTLFSNTYASANVAVGGNTLLLTDAAVSVPRPREGDLVYVPFSNTMMEIMFTEDEQQFYPHGKPQTYELRCETFQYSGEYFSTGNTFIDTIMNDLSVESFSGNTSSGSNNSGIAINSEIQTRSDNIMIFDDDDPFAEGDF